MSLCFLCHPATTTVPVPVIVTQMVRQTWNVKNLVANVNAKKMLLVASVAVARPVTMVFRIVKNAIVPVATVTTKRATVYAPRMSKRAVVANAYRARSVLTRTLAVTIVIAIWMVQLTATLYAMQTTVNVNVARTWTADAAMCASRASTTIRSVCNVHAIQTAL